MSKPPLPKTFLRKKATILAELSTPLSEYTDKSPKGSVDSQITSLIEQINAVDGLVTTSSCAGRLAVFVEGEKGSRDGDGEVEMIKAGPGGKGGGRWLFVSHERVPRGDEVDLGVGYFTTLLGLDSRNSDRNGAVLDSGCTAQRRLVRLSFAPLILHVLCASLRHARPLLAAAINAGFRESGLHSLKGLDDPEAAVMVGIRTAGLAFETVVGLVGTDEVGGEVVECVVSEKYLDMCVGVINERFGWNEERRDRFSSELDRALAAEMKSGDWEDAESRRMRKREEGLRKQKLKTQKHDDGVDVSQNNEAALDGLIFGIN